MAPRETEDNAYAKFWGDKQRALWYVMVFLEICALTEYVETIFVGLPDRRSLSPSMSPSHAPVLSCAHYFQGPAVGLQQIRSEHRIQLIVQPYKLRSKSRKAILFHVDICRRYFLVCQLKIVFSFLHELKGRSSDVTGRHSKKLSTSKIQISFYT